MKPVYAWKSEKGKTYKAMTLKETLTRLKSLSNEKMLAHNRKNGAGDNQYGVKLGDIQTVAKGIKTNHELVVELWNTGNIDAQLLAILVAIWINEMVRRPRYS